MDISKLKERLENLEKQRINTIANLGAIEGAQATIRDLITELEAEGKNTAKVIPFPTVGASREDDTHQTDVPQEG